MGLSKNAAGHSGFLMYLIAILIGSIIAAIVLGFLKPSIKKD